MAFVTGCGLFFFEFTTVGVLNAYRSASIHTSAWESLTYFPDQFLAHSRMLKSPPGFTFMALLLMLLPCVVVPMLVLFTPYCVVDLLLSLVDPVTK